MNNFPAASKLNWGQLSEKLKLGDGLVRIHCETMQFGKMSKALHRNSVVVASACLGLYYIIQ